MTAKINKLLATLYALGLGIGETVLNWGNWQYAPLWIVDYLIVAALLYGAVQGAPQKSAAILKIAWAFALGVMYMALFISLDPAMPPAFQAPGVLIGLMTLLVVLALIGLVLSLLTGADENAVEAVE